MSLNGGQANFAQCLAVSWAGTPYIHFWGLFTPNGILPGAKFTMCPSLLFSYIGCVTARHLSSRRQPNFVAWYKEWNCGTFSPRNFRCWERKRPNRILPAGKFTANGKTETNAFDYVSF